MRYQLLKTTPYLSGQVRWDIPLYYHYVDGTHVMDTPELHIVPLDDNIRFNEGNSWQTFNYSHLENIKHLFSEIGDAFYSCEGEWTGNYWLYNNGDILDPYSHTYNMGARRVRFSRYGKQFSYLCPLWISEETDPKRFEFEFSIKVSGEERDHIVRRNFGLSDEMCAYMADFLNKSARYVVPDPSAPDPGYQGVNDDLLSIKFDPDYAFITGIQANVGKFTTQDISYVINDLTDREIPMMEFDNMLVSKFRESNMIAQQLINLNFLFNMEDISYVLKESLLGKHIGISVRVKYDGEYLSIKDFYTNYDDIPVYRVDRASLSRSKNVCDYMGDNKIIDYIHTNKFTQPIFHWTMVENPTYIYNFYDGFAPVFSNGGDFQRVEGRYYDQADISQENHTVYNNAASWCKMIDGTLSSAEVINSYEQLVIQDSDQWASKLFINERTGVAYLNNNRYDIVKLDMNKYGFKDWPDIYIYSTIKTPGSVTGYDATDPNKHYTDALVISDKPGKIIIRYESDNIYYATYRILRQLIKTPGVASIYDRMINLDETGVGHYASILSKILDFFIDMYTVWTPPYRIDFTKGTITAPVDAFDDYHPEELNMYKNNAHRGYVLRYTGGLCPLFIDPLNEYYKNVVYRYNQWGTITEPEVQKYNDFLKTGMNPDYPSLGYYDFTKEPDDLNIPTWYNKWPWDVSWKNDGILYVMPERYKVQVGPVPNPTYTQLTLDEQNTWEEDNIWKELYDYIDSMGIDASTTWMKHKLKELYKLSYNFDYASEDDVNHIIYYIQFGLR